MKTSWSDLEDLKTFLEENVCSRIRLKATSDDFEDETYRIRLVHPKVSIMRAEHAAYQSDTYSAPQIVIRFMRKEEPPVRESSFEFYRMYYIELEIWVWNNGVHGNELYHHAPDGSDVLRFETSNDPNFYEAGDDGSKDAMMLCDMVENALKDHEWLNKENTLWVDKEETFITGPSSSEYGPINFEPYYCHLMQFRMVSFVQENPFDSRGGLMERRK